MQSHKFSLKFFADDAGKVNALPGDTFLRVFHSWIQRQALPDHLLIDVADYHHVPDGPGTVLVSHEANIHLDHTEGRPGLLYVRKQPCPDADTPQDRLRATFRAALAACDLLEQEAAVQGRVRFSTGEVALRVHDRLLAPNTPETFEKLKPDLQAVLSELYANSDVAIEHRPSAEKLFEVRIKATQPPSLAELLRRVGHTMEPVS
jgi:hypothetical protein